MGVGRGIRKGPVIGKITPKSSKQIAASPLGVGFETLDRKLFDPEPTYEPLGQLGIKWARVQTGWCRCETEKGKHDFEWLDDVVNSLRNVGIQPWFNLTYGNKLYSPDAVNEFAVGWTPIHTRRRGKHGYASYAIWPNTSAIASNVGKSGTTECRLFLETREAFTGRLYEPGQTDRAGDSCLDPQRDVIGGSMACAEYSYLEGCMKLGMGMHIDRVSFHPYRLIPEADYANEVRRMRDLFKRYKPSLDLWQGECGCPSTDDGIGALAQYPWNESRQARWLLRRFLNDLRLNLEHTSWYDAADQINYSVASTGAPEPGKADRLNFGLLRVPGYTPKPSYFAYQNICALFDSQTETAEVPTECVGKFSANEPAVSAKNIERASFVRDDCPLLAYWYPADVIKDMSPKPSMSPLPQGRSQTPQAGAG